MHLCLLFFPANGYDASLKYIKSRTCVHQMKDFQLCLQKYYNKIEGIDKDFHNVRNSDSKTLCCAFWDLFEVLVDQ